ncbi:hypothetical protein LDENG_00241710 [Lucifuga dentata]|nr:hypothetical protein LDENG_00241710 [Lucifuga dentata]
MDMVEGAVDDMYHGCTAKMKQIVEKKYKEEEIKQYEAAWKRAENCADRNVRNRHHMQTICIFTSNYDDFYQKFNEAVQTSRVQYSTSFPNHSLHFLLTSAIQILKDNQPCHMTYRRTKDVFTGDVNQIIRFGYFASSSLDTDLTHFGDESCFHITTCSGAFLKSYLQFEYEREVFIPPYEMFKITKILKGEEDKSGLSDCKVICVLKSADLHSNLNCKASDI